MPVIFSSSLLALPTALARYANYKPVEAVAAALNPSGPLYLPVGLLFFGFSVTHSNTNVVSVAASCTACDEALHGQLHDLGRIAQARL